LEKAKKTIDLLKLKLNELQDIPKCTICHHHPAFFIGICGHRICCEDSVIQIQVVVITFTN